MQKNTNRKRASASRGGTKASQGRRGAARRPSGFEGFILKISEMTSTRKGLLTLGGFFLALILVIALILLLASGSGGKDVSQDRPAATAAPTERPEDIGDEGTDAADGTGDAEAGDAEDAEAVDAQPTAVGLSVSRTPSPDETWSDGIYAPDPQGEGYLPVFRQAERTDNVVAITVDDCFQTSNLRQIIQLAEDVGGKLTIFPIGELLQREGLQEVIRYAHSIGFEIENHTWSHDSLYNLSAEELAAHIFNQDRAVDLVLGENYQTHFLRPRGGDDRNDLRTHSYIRQLGYYGIAHWSVSGRIGRRGLAESLKPGAVYLFHCTDDDLAVLQGFIPYIAQQGFRLVTLNEMFGYAENYTEPLEDDPRTREIVQLEPYERDYKTLKATTYDYAAYEVQAALIQKGYMKGEPDGIYGPGTAKCAAAWQKASGYKADGVLTPEQQRALLDVS